MGYAAVVPARVRERGSLVGLVCRLVSGRHVDYHYHDKGRGTTNAEVIRRFGKARDDMSLEELRIVWVWLNERYPLTA